MGNCKWDSLKDNDGVGAIIKKESIPVKTFKEIEYVLSYFNVKSPVLCLVGDWIITTEGDVIHYLRKYPIFNYQLKLPNWIEQLSDKDWFDDSQREAVVKALRIAKIVAAFKKSFPEKEVDLNDSCPFEANDTQEKCPYYEPKQELL